MSTLQLRLARLLLASIATCWAFGAAWAQSGEWPARPIRLVVPYPPGTGPDIMARLVTEKLAKELPATYVVENKPGVNGSIGTEVVVRAPADGYTFLLVDRLTVTVNPLLYKLSYDPRKDLVPVSNIADVSLYLVVSSALPVSDFRSFVTYLKANPGKVTFGSGGVGSIMHLNMVLLQDGTGTSMLHVPYKAFAEVIPAMLAGDVAVSSGGVEALQQHVAAGKLKLLAVGAPTRTASEPSVPTIKEVAGEDLLISTSYTLLARAGTPADVVARMNAALRRALADPELRAATARRGLNAYGTSPEELERVIGADAARIGKLISDHRITVQ
jgi:tripartite-type tricarboxylate transporter receptor subunit TctC